MRNIKLAKNLIALAWVYYLIYNTYFGWNWHSESISESNCDTIFKIIIYVGLIIYIIPFLKLYEKIVKDHLN